MTIAEPYLPPADIEREIARYEGEYRRRDAQARRAMAQAQAGRHAIEAAIPLQTAAARQMQAASGAVDTPALDQARRRYDDSITRIAHSRGVTVPKLSTVTQEKARVVIPIGDEELKVTYRPSKMTPRLIEQAQRAEEGGNVSAALLNLLSEVLVSWDLLDDEDEQPIPITPEGLADVPFVILRRIVEAIGLAMMPAARIAPRSPAGSGE